MGGGSRRARIKRANPPGVALALQSYLCFGHPLTTLSGNGRGLGLKVSASLELAHSPFAFVRPFPVLDRIGLEPISPSFGAFPFPASQDRSGASLS